MTARRRGPRRRANAQGVSLLRFFRLHLKARRGKVDDDQVREVLEASLPRWEAAHEADPRRGRGMGPLFRRWCTRYGVEVPEWVANLEGGPHAGEAPDPRQLGGGDGQRAN